MLRTTVLVIVAVAAATLDIRDQSPDGRDPDANGLSPFNDTDILKISKIDNTSDQWGSMAERKKGCSPTFLCNHAGGYCVKSGKQCDGKIDASGCKGKKCKCCIPDQTTPAPCPTTPAVTPCATCPPVAHCATTSMTTEGTTESSSLPWLTVASDRFVWFNQTMSWTDARDLCNTHGLDLYKPRDILAVAKYIEDNFSTSTDVNSGGKYHWLGARGNGTHMVWILSSQVVTEDEPWASSSYYNRVSTGECLYMYTFGGYPDQGRILGVASCDHTGNNVEVICG